MQCAKCSLLRHIAARQRRNERFRENYKAGRAWKPRLREGDADDEGGVPRVAEPPHHRGDERSLAEQHDEGARAEEAEVLKDEHGADHEADAREEEASEHVAHLQTG